MGALSAATRAAGSSALGPATHARPPKATGRTSTGRVTAIPQWAKEHPPSGIPAYLAAPTVPEYPSRPGSSPPILTRWGYYSSSP